MELTKSIYTLIKWRIIRCMYVSNYRITTNTNKHTFKTTLEQKQ